MFGLLLQFVSPALPLGAYNYSEGLEYLIDHGAIQNATQLKAWLLHELRYGTIRVDIHAFLQAQTAIATEDLQALRYWNQWLTGTRETKELRQQSLQMGNSFLKLLADLDPAKQPQILAYQTILGKHCHYPVALAIAVSLWEIDEQQAVLGYLHSWISNLVNAGIKLIPLGQTQGQQIVYQLQPEIKAITAELMTRNDHHAYACTWGLSLASMNHETQYTRLFRS